MEYRHCMSPWGNGFTLYITSIFSLYIISISKPQTCRNETRFLAMASIYYSKEDTRMSMKKHNNYIFFHDTTGKNVSIHGSIKYCYCISSLSLHVINLILLCAGNILEWKHRHCRLQWGNHFPITIISIIFSRNHIRCMSQWNIFSQVY